MTIKKDNQKRVQCKCQTCGKEFEILPSQHRDGRGKFCSHECSHKRPDGDPRNKRVEKKCKVCGKLFQVKAYRKDDAKYCSQECYRMGRRSGKRVCVHCGEEYEGSKAARDGSPPGKKYCSRSCRDEARNKRVKKVCEICGEEFEVKLYREKSSFCCSRKCSNERRAEQLARGELKNNYIYSQKGYYLSKCLGKKEQYDSSWEKLRMIQLDRLEYKWTKKHGLSISYYDTEGIQRRYVPDFYVKDGEEEWVEEVKPSSMVNNPDVLVKRAAAICFCQAKGWDYRMVTEHELGIQGNSAVEFKEDVVEDRQQRIFDS